eukprot:CAMPEP_0172858286 /NCGR_PEP_ID=MMETSP1075-20121228/66255_1 /TAXON_ID=2916 /ORGANISM="Ceratium fusus, Strain PA161109" /LENGTH=571 /DNA_ID=CAMNT_0013705793 /DNA_START=48 /DNA_END=1763 /DNA_ORIENTATION=-
MVDSDFMDARGEDGMAEDHQQLLPLCGTEGASWPSRLSQCAGVRWPVAAAALLACSVLTAGVAIVHVHGPLRPLRKAAIGSRGVPDQQKLDAVGGGASVKIWQTAREQGHLERLTDTNLAADFDFSGPTVTVDVGARDQQIVGFGGAFTESSAVTFQKMNPTLQEQFLSGYFDEAGLGFTVGRVHINSCDFSVASYSFDDHAGDVELQYFDSEASHDSQALIPLIQRAQQRISQRSQSMRLLATPWSPPSWMKGNAKMDTSSRPCIRPEYRDTWARYLAKWVSTYKAKGVPIWAMTVQNEPQGNSSWEACLMAPPEEADFLGEHLGPVMKSAHPEVSIFVHDDQKNMMPDYARAAFSHPTANKYTDGVAFHWYTGDWFDKVAEVHRQYPGAMLLASEATYEKRMWKPGAVQAYPEWRFGEGYAHDIIGDLNAGAMGWIDWNLLLDMSGGPNHVGNMCDAAAVADLQEQVLHWHPQYYYMGHFSKFILPGSTRLQTSVEGSTAYAGTLRGYGTCTGQDGLQATSFVRPDRQIVTVVLNCGDGPIEFKLRVGSGALRASVPAHGIQTYLLPAS